MKKRVLFVLCFMLLMGGMAVLGSSPAEAGSKIVPIEGAKYMVTFPMSKNIAMYKDKHITVLLKGGQIMTGKVMEVNDSHLHLSELSGGEDFLDALINVDAIIAIKAKFRKYE
ncbi:MAG: hypothetical protein OEW15_13900 [Nitrospirota bacterium]|nr:hypothetical protein [Nitrospirota bacterium]